MRLVENMLFWIGCLYVECTGLHGFCYVSTLSMIVIGFVSGYVGLHGFCCMNMFLYVGSVYF